MNTRIFKKFAAFVLLLGVSVLAFAQDTPSAENAAAPSEAEQQAQMDTFVKSLKLQSGTVTLPNNIATLNLPEKFSYLNAADAERVLTEAWGNPPGSQSLGLIVPSNFDPFNQASWAVVITYDEDGHVNDDDAKDINYDDLLKDMQAGTKESNEERVKQGYPSMSLVGWAEKPSYDSANHKLYWAKELSVDGASEHTLNYNIRILGRKGVLVLNAIAGIKQLGEIKTEMQKVIAFTDFTKGNTYVDYNKATDKTAEYGIAALVAGGVAAKLGFFGKLFALLIAFKKVLIIAVIGLFAGIKKFLGFKNKDSNPQ